MKYEAFIYSFSYLFNHILQYNDMLPIYIYIYMRERETHTHTQTLPTKSSGTP